MRAKRAALYKLRHKNFLVNLSANAYIPFPLRGRSVVRRRCGQRNNGTPTADFFNKLLQGLLPFVLQMVRLVKAQRAYAVLLNHTINIHRRVVHLLAVRRALHPRRRRVQRLICNRGYRLRSLKVGGNKRRKPLRARIRCANIRRARIAYAHKAARKPLAPLLAYGGCGRQNKARLAQSSYKL